MKRFVKYGVLVLAFLFLLSWKKDVISTDIEKIEKELKAFINTNDIKKCSIILVSQESSYVEHENTEFSISGGFVIVKASANGGEYEDRYNLLYLSKYRLSIDNHLGLYFISQF